MSQEKKMKVLQWDKIVKEFPDCPKTVPFDILNEKWAQNNHSQTLDRLNERGGLVPSEIVAIANSRPWRQVDTKAAIMAINNLISAYNHFSEKVKVNPKYTNEEYLDLHGAPDGAYPPPKNETIWGKKKPISYEYPEYKLKELLSSAFKSGEEFGNECHCGECDYCREFTGNKEPDFETWYKINVTDK